MAQIGKRIRVQIAAPEEPVASRAVADRASSLVVGGPEGTPVSGDDALAEGVQAAGSSFCAVVAARCGLPLLTLGVDTNGSQSTTRLSVPSGRLPESTRARVWLATTDRRSIRRVASRDQFTASSSIAALAQSSRLGRRLKR